MSTPQLPRARSPVIRPSVQRVTHPGPCAVLCVLTGTQTMMSSTLSGWHLSIYLIHWLFFTLYWGVHYVSEPVCLYSVFNALFWGLIQPYTQQNKKNKRRYQVLSPIFMWKFRLFNWLEGVMRVIGNKVTTESITPLSLLTNTDLEGAKGFLLHQIINWENWERIMRKHIAQWRWRHIRYRRVGTD